MKKSFGLMIMLLFLTTTALPSFCIETRVVRDAEARDVRIPSRVDGVICSGPGSLRLLTYLEAQHMIVAVDDMEKRRPRFDARPYALANPQFKSLPLFGEFRGHDNPERIMTLNPQPQVIFKTYKFMGHDPEKLQKKTGIPVIILEYGDLGQSKTFLYQALSIMGEVVSKQNRAEEVIAYFESCIMDLKGRTRAIPENRRKTCFVGGIAFKGPHGFQSTEPGYPPFDFVCAKNVAYGPFMKGRILRQSNVSKEKIIEWDPEVLFLDLATMQMGGKAGALYELKTDPAYRTLSAVQKGDVYGLLPYNWYTQNFGSILANAYFIGKLLCPDRFREINPAAKANEIYSFLVGKPVFDQMNEAFQGLAFKKIPLE